MTHGAAAYEFEAELWRWRGEDGPSWFFLSLPFDVTDEIDESAGPKRGFGSVRVEATIGSSTWRTSIFPSKEYKTYVLPVKMAVRKANALDEGSRALVQVRLCD